MEEGMEIGKRARQLFPGGVLIPPQEIELAANQTARLIADQKVPTIFEATFCVEGYVAKADVLLRDKRGWHPLEVKSPAVLPVHSPTSNYKERYLELHVEYMRKP